MRSGRQVDWRLLAAVMLGMLLIQMIVPASRAATSYLSIDIGLDAAHIGILSASYALLPVLLTVQIGRIAAMRAGRPAMVIGALLIVLAIGGLAWAPKAFWTMVAFTTILGVGQTLGMTALQTIAIRASGRHNRDMVLGNTSMAIAVGHALGPVLIWAAAWAGAGIGPSVLVQCALLSVPLLITSLVVTRRVAQRHAPRPVDSAASGLAIWRVPGMPWILTVGALSATTLDLLIVFVPLLGLDQGWSPEFVGLLLILRALASIAVRFLYARLVRLFGRRPLMLGALAVAVAGLLVLALPLPDFAPALAMLACGFGLGIVGTNSIAMALGAVAPSGHAAAISMRLGTNRLLQFVLPLGAGIIATGLGAGSVFAIVAACLAGNAIMLRFQK